MTERNSHPAVFAGLLGSAAWSVPTLAMASPLEDVSRAIQGSLVLQFVVGCMAGAAIAGTASAIVDRIAESRHAEEDDESQADESRWSSSSVDIALAQARAAEEEKDDDPTGDLGRFRTGQITIDLPVIEEQKSEPKEQKVSAPRHARHAKSPASTHVVAKRPAARTGRHFSTVGKSEPAVLSAAATPKAPAAKARHFATNAAPAPQKVEQALEPQVAAILQDAKKPEDTFAGINAPLVEPAPIKSRSLASLPEVPVITPMEPLIKSSVTSSAVKRAPAAKKASVAKKATVTKKNPQTTGRLRIRERLAARTKNVREVLSARLDDDALAGVPVITRADGTSVDVNPTWFDQTLVPVLANITGVSQKVDDTASIRSSASGATQATNNVPANTDRASYISRHVAEVNEGMFPERRSSDELDHKDAFEEALAAMGETLGQTSEPQMPAVPPVISNMPVFHDVVGGPSTIDDPEGLEPPTGFIPFRVPAAHPEVVDTETYVDYLLRDELSNSGQEVLRRSKHAHLRVIEGGTSPLRTRRKASDTGSVRSARHFATTSYAREA